MSIEENFRHFYETKASLNRCDYVRKDQLDRKKIRFKAYTVDFSNKGNALEALSKKHKGLQERMNRITKQTESQLNRFEG